MIGHLRFADENGRETELLERSYSQDGTRCTILGGVGELELPHERTSVAKTREDVRERLRL